MSQVPSAVDSERAAIGAALCNDEYAELVTSELRETDFYNNDNALTFRAVRKLRDSNLAVSPISVAELSGVGQSTTAELADKGRHLTQGQLKTLLSEVKRVGRLRTLYYTLQSGLKRIRKDADTEEILSGLETELYSGGGTEESSAVDGTAVLQTVLADFKQRFATGGGPVLSTGLKALDRAILGLRGGKMVVIAARPSMGKTALADTIRRSVLQQGQGCIQFSLEMSAEEILERELAFQSKCNLRKILSAKELTPDEYGAVIGVGGQTSGVEGRWFIDDRSYTIGSIRRRARILSGQMARKGIKTGCVILDYIQLAGDNGEGREQSVAAISRGCKLLAKELDCTVLALSQLNRACENREDRRPMMADLRESGSIEQDADIVAFVYREHMYDPSVPAEEAELIIRKHRSGPTGTVRLKYNPKTVHFSDPDQLTLTENVQDA